MSDLNLWHGLATDGGAIHNLGYLTLGNVAFNENRASGTGGNLVVH